MAQLHAHKMDSWSVYMCVWHSKQIPLQWEMATELEEYERKNTADDRVFVNCQFQIDSIWSDLFFSKWKISIENSTKNYNCTIAQFILTSKTFVYSFCWKSLYFRVYVAISFEFMIEFRRKKKLITKKREKKMKMKLERRIIRIMSYQT